MSGQWDSVEYTRLNELVHDSPLPDLVRAISDHSDRRTLARLLDAELERRERHLRLMREYRNMFSIPIHSLPPEVLSHVLFLSACDEEDHTLFTLGWTRLLLVCRRWRDIAWSTPSLWSFVSLEPPELVSFPPPTIHNDMIIRRVSLQRQRAGANPIHARIYLNGPRYDDEFFRVYQPFPWITSSLKTLHASGTTSGLSDFLARMDAHDHPLLSQLVVRLIVHESQKPLPSIPGDFLARHVSLHELNVANVLVDFQGLSNLQSLDILHGYHYNAPIEIDEVLDALSRCPTLESLRLNLPRSATTSSRNSRPGIKLPNLGSVLLQGTYTAVTHLLFPLQIPASSRISLASLEEVQPQDIAPLVTYLNAHCCLSSSSINCIGLNETTSLALHLFEMRFYTRSSLENENDPFLIRLGVVAPEPGIRAELAALTLSRLPVRNATLFDVRHMNECHSMVLRSVFERLPSLSTIAVSFGRPSLGQLLELLKARLAVRLPAPVSHIVIDATHTLKVARAVSRSYGARSQSTPFRSAQRELETVLAYCSAAKRARMPLDVLEIINDGDNDSAIVAPTSGSAKKRLWRDLTGGFVHNGVMRNRAVVDAELQEVAEGFPENSAKRASLLKELSA
ncbi:hypothetical protein PENSPDRAFT_732664 [Peniophora sp. CONT]|nr:hypothetical protein PENSPDRAFT_732664 [Peniophora sp. CONT]